MPDNANVERVGRLTVYLNGAAPLDAVLRALDAPGETLKTSRKSRTKRVDGWVVKESRFEKGVGPLKRTFHRSRYRRAWRAANRLIQAGIRAPHPRAFIEIGVFGLIWKNALISDFLEGFVNVEAYARELMARQANEATIAAFLEGIAEAVNSLDQAGAHHTDLSGKNILTEDGQTFYFMDLDGVVLDQPYPDALRMKNHIQLYDSFCDLWGEDQLGPFIARMQSPTAAGKGWFETVKSGQARRRARIEAIWRKQGRC